jgi:hypothetical protein
MRENPDLAPLVSEAGDQLARFIPDARLKIEPLPDPDYGDGEQLFLGVHTMLPGDEALEALRRFDQEWWVLNAGRAQGLLYIDLSDE